MMMSCDKKFLLKCQQCLFLRLLLPVPTLLTCVFYVSYPKPFDRNFEIVGLKYERSRNDYKILKNMLDKNDRF